MNRAATIALAPLSLIYGAAVRIRLAFYRTGIFKTHKFATAIISVGNVTTGGTGKTPLVEWIAKRLADRGHRVCVLTRGYRRARPKQRVLVSNGKQITSDLHQAGDEPMMLAQALLGKAAVVCDANRVTGAEWAIKNLDADVIILDDGFQHVRIGRDFNIVTVDATNPWGNGRLLPAGTLREGLNTLRRADCIVVTRGEPDQGLRARIRKTGPAQVFSSKTLIQSITTVNPPDGEAEKEARGLPLAAFCGIGNPNAFFEQLRDEGFELQHTEAFRDHHKYSQADIDTLTRRAASAGARALITTAKDAVKLRALRFTLPCYVAEIRIEVAEADKLLELINTAIQRKLLSMRDN